MDPSMTYLDELSGGNEEFKKKIVKIILAELPEEYTLYKHAIAGGNYFWASEIVHRIIQKIAFFQLEESYKKVEKHEKYLREGNLKYHPYFNEVVAKILNFLPKYSI